MYKHTLAFQLLPELQWSNLEQSILLCENDAAQAKCESHLD